MKTAKIKIGILFILLIVVVTNLFISRKTTFKVINYDVISYYAYLPATFIYKDVTLKFIEKDWRYFGCKFWVDTLAPHKYMIRTTMGISMLYSPFFFAAHAYTKFTGQVADGYTPPYPIALIISSIFYFMLGLFFLSKFLLHYFRPNIVVITLILISLGTNLFAFITMDAAMSHAYSFSLIATLLYVTREWYESGKFKYAVYLGLLGGLITLVRPTNAIVALLVVLFGISGSGDLLIRFNFYRKNYLHLLVIVVLAFAMWIPQMLYWHKITGQFLFNSYDSSGGSFYFGNPQIINQLFAFRKGLFIYTPLMLFACTGIIMLYKAHKNLFWGVATFTAVNIYVLSCWWAWWFGGGFGCRGYIDSFAVMAIGLAAFVDFVATKQRWIRMFFSVLIGFFVFLNLFQTYQYYKGYLHYVAMSKASYFAAFLDPEPGKDYYDNLVMPNYKNAKKGIYYQDEKTFREEFESKSEKDRLLNYEKYIRSNAIYMEAEKKKAAEKGITIDSMIKLDARWLMNKDNEDAKKK
jgi:hypothetical protein